MNEANRVARALWDASETVRILPEIPVTHRMLELIEDLGLGRKRILDTALAAALDLAGIRTLVTLNAKDYRIFSFLEVITPA